MSNSSPRNSHLCPSCRKLISRSVSSCPFCGLSNPSSPMKNNILTKTLSDGQQLITILITINVVMFALSILIDPRVSSFNFNPLHFLSPSHHSLLILGSTGTIPVFQFERWWSLLSANYLHGGLMHILFNMLALRQLAPLVMQEYGTYRSISIYTLGGIVGFLISSFAGVQYTIGASAALCSLIGALLYYGKSRGGIYGQAVFSQIGGWALGIGVFGFMFPGINNWGHGGGMVAGILLGWLLGYHDKFKETSVHKILATGCVIATICVLSWSCLQALLVFLS